jgi:hypothetical protein
MKSSSESIGEVVVVRGVGGASLSETAEAILLLDLVVVLEEGSIASAAFLFLSWEEMVSTGDRCLNLSGGQDSRHAHKAVVWDTRADDSGR